MGALFSELPYLYLVIVIGMGTFSGFYLCFLWEAVML